jgi:hypothetical protein
LDLVQHCMSYTTRELLRQRELVASVFDLLPHFMESHYSAMEKCWDSDYERFIAFALTCIVFFMSLDESNHVHVSDAVFKALVQVVGFVKYSSDSRAGLSASSSVSSSSSSQASQKCNSSTSGHAVLKKRKRAGKVLKNFESSLMELLQSADELEDAQKSIAWSFKSNSNGGDGGSSKGYQIKLWDVSLLSLCILSDSGPQASQMGDPGEDTDEDNLLRQVTHSHTFETASHDKPAYMWSVFHCSLQWSRLLPLFVGTIAGSEF